MAVATVEVWAEVWVVAWAEMWVAASVQMWDWALAETMVETSDGK
jgi:hypothetical protein